MFLQAQSVVRNFQGAEGSVWNFVPYDVSAPNIGLTDEVDLQRGGE